MGLSRDVASSMGWLKMIHPKDRAAVEEQWRSFIEKGNEIAVEQRLLRKDG
jgi:hypothetical protein